MASASNIPGIWDPNLKPRKDKKKKDDGNSLQRFVQRISERFSSLKSEIKEVDERTQKVQLRSYKVLNEKIDGAREEAEQKMISVGQHLMDEQNELRTKMNDIDAAIGELPKMKTKIDEMEKKLEEHKEREYEEAENILIQEEVTDMVPFGDGNMQTTLDDMLNKGEQEVAELRTGPKWITLQATASILVDDEDARGIDEKCTELEESKFQATMSVCLSRTRDLTDLQRCKDDETTEEIVQVLSGIVVKKPSLNDINGGGIDNKKLPRK